MLILLSGALLIGLVCVLSLLFFSSSKMFFSENLNSSVFECGFSSWFFSRFSFSIHYFLVGLIFLFLDLELCLIMPLMLNCPSMTELTANFLIFVLVLVLGLIYEWGEGKLEWVS